jgi:hypothetical protein
LFLPLATVYNHELAKLMSNSQGMVLISKQFFWLMFKASWEALFTEANIASGFAKTGIWPHNPNTILTKIKRLELLPLVLISQE